MVPVLNVEYGPTGPREEPRVNTPGPRRSETVTVYAAGLFQGLSLVAVPAAATILTSADGYDLSASQYGLLFLPQVILAIASKVLE